MGPRDKPEDATVPCCMSFWTHEVLISRKANGDILGLVPWTHSAARSRHEIVLRRVCEEVANAGTTAIAGTEAN